MKFLKRVIKTLKKTAFEESFYDVFFDHETTKSLVRVPVSYMKDPFNMFQLPRYVSNYDEALESLISGQLSPLFFGSCVHLYALVHQRYILTEEGLNLMHELYQAHAFGVCPRSNCGAAAIPTSLTNTYDDGSVLLYCPCCKQLFKPSSEDELSHLDGAFIGTNFAGVFCAAYPNVVKPGPVKLEKKAYGFRIFDISQYPEVRDKYPDVFSLE